MIDVNASCWLGQNFGKLKGRVILEPLFDSAYLEYVEITIFDRIPLCRTSNFPFEKIKRSHVIT